MVEVSDWELVQKCQAGDMSAFQELVSRYQQKVFMVILGLLRNREDALEVAQEAFFRAYRKIKSFQGGSTFYTWLYRIAVNIAIDQQRRQKRNPLDFRESMDGRYLAPGFRNLSAKQAPPPSLLATSMVPP